MMKMKKRINLPPLRCRVAFIFLLAGILVGFSGHAQQESTITGTVRDSLAGPLAGVTVIQKGTSTQVTTDSFGRFSISVSTSGATLVFSSVGYETEEIGLTGARLPLEVVLQPEVQNLDEIIVVGYGTMKKSDLTGSVTRVALEDKPVPNVNLTQALSGASAGVNIQQNGLAGGEASLSIRGKTSLSANDNPLIVLDGIIFNGSLSDINVNDVEYIDILRDASAAAVYGSRSANGVIIITTKKGKTGAPRISFNANYGYQGMTNNPMKVMNAEQYAIRLVDYFYQQELYNWYRTNPTSDTGRPVRPDVTNRETVAARLRTEEERQNYLAGNEINWVDQVLRDQASIANYDASFSGASERVNYYASGSIAREEGILKNDQFDRYTFNSKVDGKLTDWLSLGLNVNYSYRDYSGVNASLEDARVASPLANNDLASPDDYVTFLTNEGYMPHPLGQTKATNEDIRNNLFFVANAKVEIPYIKGLTYDFNFSNTFNYRKNNTFWPVSIENGNTNNGRAERRPEETRQWIFNNILSYNQTFGDHDINGTLLYSREKYFGQSYILRVEGFENPLLGFNNLNMGTVVTVVPPGDSDPARAWEEQGVSYMARLNYQYKRRYMITGTVRRDGFSGFGPDSKFVTLPSVSLGWVVSEEPFWKEGSSIYTKLRLSYGQNGNQGIGRYSSFAQMGTEYYVYDSSTSISLFPNRIGNPGLRWEKTSSVNLGVDFGFWNNRLAGSVDGYLAKTSDVLVKRKLPGAAGYADIWSNIGGLDNKGLDVELRSENIRTPDLNWKTNVVFSINRNKISKLYGGKNDVDIGNEWFVGEPISALYDYEMLGGLWAEEDLYAGRTYTGWYPGQYKYADLNSDNRIDPQNDRKIVGYADPNYRFSIGNTLTWKNFSLYVLLNSIQGGNGYYLRDNYTIVNVNSRSDDVLRMNQSAVRPYWTPDNGVNNATGVYNSAAVTSRIFESRSFVRIQDVSLTYTFGNNLLQRMGSIDNLQIFLSGKNIYTWTKWSGWDPEIASANANYPAMRNVSLGLRLTL